MKTWPRTSWCGWPLFRFRADALARAGGEHPLQRIPLPASYMLRVCGLDLANPDAYLQLQCAGNVLGYILFKRPGSAACMRPCDVSFTELGLELQEVDFKVALRTGRERLAFTVPVDWDGNNVDHVSRLLLLGLQRHDEAERHP